MQFTQAQLDIIARALEFTASESTLDHRKGILPAGDRSNAPLYALANEIRRRPRPFYCGECEVTHRDSVDCRA